jgi:hypothetical protein
MTSLSVRISAHNERSLPREEGFAIASMPLDVVGDGCRRHATGLEAQSAQGLDAYGRCSYPRAWLDPKHEGHDEAFQILNAIKFQVRND